MTSPTRQVPVTSPPRVLTESVTARGALGLASGDGAALVVVGAALLVEGTADVVTPPVLTSPSVNGSPTRPAAAEADADGRRGEERPHGDQGEASVHAASLPVRELRGA